MINTAINGRTNTAWLSTTLACLAFSVPLAARAEIPAAETILPESVVACLSVADPADLEARWDRTQLGQFAADPKLQPFVDHMRDTIPRRLGNMEERVGITVDDLQDVAGGELAWAIVSRTTASGQNSRAASVLLIDTTGHSDNRDALIAQIDEHLIGRKSTKATDQVNDITITTYEVPPYNADEKVSTAAYFVYGDLLCVADHTDLVKELAARVDGNNASSLSSVEAYAKVMAKCSEHAGTMTPDVRWFIKPFPLVDAIRTIRTRARTGEDRAQQLRDQGFDAVQGVGGFVHVSYDEQHDFIHRTAVYAPASPAAEEGQKYRLGMNVLKLPNSPSLQLHNWTPRMIARYTTVNIDLLHAFDSVDTLFDTMVAGYDGAFETAMERFKSDPFGPQIDFRNQIIAALGSRVCLMTDYTLPIDTDSERFLVAINVKPEKVAALKVALGKYLKQDNYIEKQLKGRDIWEFQPEEEEYEIGAGDGGLFGEDDFAETDDDERLLSRSAVCVTDGQLFIASDVEFLRLAFQQAAENESLAESFDYIAVSGALAKLAPNQQCSWSFTRTDESLRPTYVLLRNNRLPESESFFARLLNELLTSPENQKNQLLRKQKLDGAELPPFELARRYFGPTGRTIKTEDDGWFMTGVMLNKAAN